MREIEKIAENLFDKIRSRFENVSLGDEKAQATTDPSKAKFFNFDYVSKDGKNFGNVHISIVDANSIKVYYGQNITDELDPAEQDEWFSFLRNLRDFARRNMMTFDTRDISRANLSPKAVRQQSKTDDTYSADEISITEDIIVESSMYGSRINSYEDRGPVKIRVKHSDFIDPDKRGSRARKIEDIYLETHRGERFLLAHKNLHYARAMARHLSEGGVMHDELGEHISGIMQEMAAMKHFVNGARRRQFEDRETQDMVGSALKHYEQQKNLLKRLRKSKDYHDYTESYMPQNDIEEDVNVDALRERFVKKVYDDRFDEALPYVYRAHQREQAAMETAMAEEFASWADQVHEGSWSDPDTEDELYKLDKIMAVPFEIGQDANNAIATMSNIIGDDALNDDLRDLYSATDDPETDARPVVMKWLRQHHPDLAAKYDTNAAAPEAPAAAPGQPTPAPEQPPVPNQTVGATTMDQPVVTEDSLSLIRMLAGLK
jgi:hypothetical protein